MIPATMKNSADYSISYRLMFLLIINFDNLAQTSEEVDTAGIQWKEPLRQDCVDVVINSDESDSFLKPDNKSDGAINRTFIKYLTATEA